MGSIINGGTLKLAGDAATLGVGIEDVRAIEKALIEFSQAAQNLNAILRDGFHAQ